MTAYLERYLLDPERRRGGERDRDTDRDREPPETQLTAVLLQKYK